MSFFNRFKKKRSLQPETTEKAQPISPYIELPEYIKYEGDKLLLLSIVTSAIAAEDHSNCHIRVRNIWQRNPEVQRVSLITTAIAAQDASHSNFVVKKIAKKENCNAKKI